MKKKKSLLRILLPWVIVAALLAALVIFVGIPLYAPQPASTLPAPAIHYYEDKAKTFTMENDDLLFVLDTKNTHFSVTEKATGRQWLSNPKNAAKDPVAVAANKAMLQSTLAVAYSSASGTIDFNNFQYGIENGNYLIQQDDNGDIRVTYSVGKIEKIYLLPQAITVERFTAFTDAMSKKDAKKVKNVYTLYKPEKVAEREDKDQLLALYPSLAEQSLYVLKSDTSESNKKKNAEYFASAGYNEEEFAIDQQLVAGAKATTNPVFNVTMIYKLDGKDLVVEIPYSELRYREEYPITSLTVLPMFGAAGKDEEGFMFVPEGGGALIRYNNGKLSQNSYYANLYGWDYASERTEVVNETQASFPVFGMTGQGGSFICMIEGAAPYAGIQADIAMRYNTYNWACAKYTVLHSDKYNVSAKTANLVYMFEKEMPEDTIVQRYRFIDSADYVDMAKAYGAYLKEKHPELAGINASAQLPTTVEIVGAIDKRVVKFGMPVLSTEKATSFAEAEAIIADLNKTTDNLSVRFSGWMNGGVNQKVLTNVRVLWELGGDKAMQTLIASAKGADVPLYFDGVSCFAYRSGVLQGFIPYRDAARYTTREEVELQPYSHVTFLPEEWQDYYYLVQPSYARRMASNLIEALEKQNAAGVAFRDIGSMLSGDYNSKANTTRQQALDLNLEAIQQAKDAGQKIMVKEGFDYVLPHVDMITDMTLRGTQYAILDDNVPFYQIALHGLVEYTGAPINLAADWQTEVLECAEYGAGLSFTFMHEDAKMIQETNHPGYYGATYTEWEKEAKVLIDSWETEMAGLNQLAITDHEILARDVAVTTYEDGRQVWVNYTSAPYEADGVTVPARSYIVTGKGEN